MSFVYEWWNLSITWPPDKTTCDSAWHTAHACLGSTQLESQQGENMKQKDYIIKQDKTYLYA
jgi:hypothetical protein